jgi:hypothetical protein
MHRPYGPWDDSPCYTVACSLKAGIVYLEDKSLLGYNTVNSDATTEYFTPRNVSNGSSSENDIL